MIYLQTVLIVFALLAGGWCVLSPVVTLYIILNSALCAKKARAAVAATSVAAKRNASVRNIDTEQDVLRST